MTARASANARTRLARAGKRNTRLWVDRRRWWWSLVVALLPALVAYRYTSPVQRGDFVSHPWRGWSFIAAALRVPGDSELKTSGEALRKAEWLFRADRDRAAARSSSCSSPPASPTPSTQEVAGIRAEAEVTPEYRFIWEVRGTVPTGPGAGAPRETAVVALLDYETGRLLYDVRDDLPGRRGSRRLAGADAAVLALADAVSPGTPSRDRPGPLARAMAVAAASRVFVLLVGLRRRER